MAGASPQPSQRNPRNHERIPLGGHAESQLCEIFRDATVTVYPNMSVDLRMGKVTDPILFVLAQATSNSRGDGTCKFGFRFVDSQGQNPNIYIVDTIRLQLKEVGEGRTAVISGQGRDRVVFDSVKIGTTYKIIFREGPGRRAGVPVDPPDAAMSIEPPVEPADDGTQYEDPPGPGDLVGVSFGDGSQEIRKVG